MRKQTVNPKSGLYAILGDPISHSMSPVIMNSAFDRLDMDTVFLALKANLETFDQVMTAMKLIDLKGYVFTMPVKEVAVPYMDELSDEAEIIGAINCVVNKDGKLIGYKPGNGKPKGQAVDESKYGFSHTFTNNTPLYYVLVSISITLDKKLLFHLI